MNRDISPEDIAKRLDPYSMDPLHAIDMVVGDNKPIGLMLHLRPQDAGNEDIYKNIAEFMQRYNGTIDPFMSFTEVIGFEPTNAQVAKQIVKDQKQGLIHYISRISIDPMAMQLSGKYQY